MKNTGIQPEVSCIMRIMDDGESDYALSDFEDEVHYEFGFLIKL